MPRKTYTLHVEERALKYLASLSKKEQRQIAKKMESLKQNPYPPYARPLRGMVNYYRIRSGKYRVIYTVNEGKIAVYVVRISHRKDAYRNLRN